LKQVRTHAAGPPIRLKNRSAGAELTPRRRWQILVRDRYLYGMLLPGILFFIIFKYVPMWGVLIAFKNYQPFLGFTGSEWVGLKHFIRLFTDPDFSKLFRNTIIIALMLNELHHQWYKRFVQTVIYIPHFFSWVAVVGIAYVLFTTEGGAVNQLLESFGAEKINVLASESWFRTMITAEVVWKETGWGTIIFLAALAGVDPQLYEAARMDGANRWRQLWHITLPALRTVIVIMFILRLGSFLDTGFEQIFLMLNATNREVGEVFDTYVYTIGIINGQFSYSTAIGLFKSVIGLILVIAANHLAKVFGEEGVY
jgi:putative aldouronate transport system permease protein